MIVAYLKEDTLKLFVVEPRVPNPSKINERKEVENTIDSHESEKLDKVDFYKKTSGMICSEVVTWSKT